MEKITLDKTYRLRNGCEATVITINNHGTQPVIAVTEHGSVFSCDAYGHHSIAGMEFSGMDLVKVDEIQIWPDTESKMADELMRGLTVRAGTKNVNLFDVLNEFLLNGDSDLQLLHEALQREVKEWCKQHKTVFRTQHLEDAEF